MENMDDQIQNNIQDELELNPVVQQNIKSLRDKIGCSSVTTTIPKVLCDSLTQFIWDIKYLNAQWPYYRRILNDLNVQFENGNLMLMLIKDKNQEKAVAGEDEDEDNNLEDGGKDLPSDIQDLLEYKPTEIIADKCTQILLLLCTGEIDSCYNELDSLKLMLEQPCVQLQNDSCIGFKFLGRTLESFANFIIGRAETDMFADTHSKEHNGSSLPNIQDLSFKSQIVVAVAKCLFARHFRHSIVERIQVLKEAEIDDPSNFEWFITRSELCRRRRRESRMPMPGGKRPGLEEFDVVAEAYILAPENPYVLLSILDCAIDCLRDYTGAFECGSLKFESADETFQFLRATSKKLLAAFPNSVKIHSQLSDYFCRFVPFRYFDVPFAEKCLNRAYQLNPRNPKTTHRLGIFHRMSKGDIETSFHWFKKTVKLDPMHFNAAMECVKNKMARPIEEKVVQYIDGLITKPVIGSDSVIRYWSEHEILELLFYKGLAHFAVDEPEKALDIWKIVVDKNDVLFRLNELDRTCGFYHWNEKFISSDRLRVWVNEQKNLIKSAKAKETKNENGDIVPVENNSLDNEERNKLIDLLFSLMIAGGHPTRPCQNSGPFHGSPTYQLLVSKTSKAGGDNS